MMLSRKLTNGFLRDFKDAVQLTINGERQELELSPSVDEAVTELSAFFSSSETPAIIRGAAIHFDKLRILVA